MRVRIVVGCLLTLAKAVCEDGGPIDVEVLVFSGTENPRLRLEHRQRSIFCAAATRAVAPVPTCRVLGFTGWRACSRGSCKVFRGSPAVDRMLLRALHRKLKPSVYEHVKQEAARLLTSHDECTDEVDGGASAECAAPVVGPDDPAKVHFDKKADDGGCFVARQSENNCYDYGNDIVTNTFAQPGRGSGVCPPGTRPCVPNTCEDVKRGALSDGLIWVGTELPSALPAEGHYVSLHIWPDTNFHWLRMDANKKWSHKPGGSPVRNVDNNGKLITDPSKADVSPWSEHCGYLLTTPSKVVHTLNSTRPVKDLII